MGKGQMVIVLLHAPYWSVFLDKADSTGLGYKAVGAPTLEMWCNSWNSSPAANSSYNKVSAKGYCQPHSSSSTAYETTFYIVKGDYENSSFSPILGDNDVSLWFPYYTNPLSDKGPWYYIASENETYTYGVRGQEVEECTETYAKFRPVVCLNEDVAAAWDATSNVYRLVK